MHRESQRSAWRSQQAKSSGNDGKPARTKGHKPEHRAQASWGSWNGRGQFNKCPAGTSSTLQLAQCVQRLTDRRGLLQRVQLAKPDSARLAHHKHRALAHAAARFLLAEHAIRPAYLAVRPEVAADHEIQRPDLALPRGRVHDRVHRYAHDLGMVFLE